MSAEQVQVRLIIKDARFVIARHLDGYTNLCGQLDAAEEVVAELAAAAARTIRAFEALGNADGIVANIHTHRECEAAMLAQKAAVARIGGTP